MDIPEEHLEIIVSKARFYARRWGLPFSNERPQVVLSDTPQSPLPINEAPSPDYPPYEDDSLSPEEQPPIEQPEDNTEELLEARQVVKEYDVGGLRPYEKVLRDDDDHSKKRTWHTLTGEDLIQAGVLAYLEAAERKGGAEYLNKTYIHQRVKGAIIDKLRELSGYRLPRGKRTPVKKRGLWIIDQYDIKLCPPGPGLRQWPFPPGPSYDGPLVSYSVLWFITYYKFNRERTIDIYWGEDDERPENAPPMFDEYLDNIDFEEEENVGVGKLLREIHRIGEFGGRGMPLGRKS